VKDAGLPKEDRRAGAPRIASTKLESKAVGARVPPLEAVGAAAYWHGANADDHVGESCATTLRRLR
jgi:hypothetical protein